MLMCLVNYIVWQYFSVQFIQSLYELPGMNDLLSPILLVMEDESESFWCFVALMECLGPNFNRDQSGMHSQLFALSKVSNFKLLHHGTLFVGSHDTLPLFGSFHTVPLFYLEWHFYLKAPVLPRESTSHENQERTDVGISDVSASIPQYNGKRRQKFHDPARDISIQVLEKFSFVTKFARETTSQLFRESHGNGFRPLERRKSNQSDDYSHKPSDDAEGVAVQSPVAPDPVEKVPYREHNRDGEAATNVGTFELISYKEFDKLSLVWGKPRQPPLGLEEWATFLDSEGRVVDSKALRKRIFYGGIEHKLRKEVWAILLGHHTYESTYAERKHQRSIKKTEYETIKSQWQSISPAQAKRFTKFRERKGLIEKDVVRTDRSLSFYDGDDNPNVNLLRDILLTYSFYNFHLGYCQLVELLDNPLHNHFKQNDCLNYFFCFRWMLIQFKRELEYEKTMRLWEVLWTHYLSEHLHLYLSVAILKRYRGKIIGEQMDFDTLIRFINELSGRIDLDATLRDAEALCICAGERGADCIPPGTPPSLPVDNGLLYSQQDEVL
ncbi:hypothetical protein GOBAR_AA36853 [Gossypium barbadense]|uniref:Rab-GAP TBC domain-containing protein n=1 Tax=Gossypium barbadense TaxID=3634 RepID=A0A2P5VYG4_GOSBA|nr:hypothetical protein GOBAR_AA36853 [Gossypium barbadense]